MTQDQQPPTLTLQAFSNPIHQGTLDNLHAAIHLMFNPLQPPSPQQMQEANKFLTDFKNSPASLMYSFALIERTRDDVDRSYGFHILESSIKLFWSQMDDQLKKVIVDKLFEYMRSGTKGVLQEPSFVREKIGIIFCQIARREWPQRMPSLLDALIGTMEINMECCYYSMVCIRIFVTDVLQNFATDLHEDRRKEITKNLKKVLSSGFIVKLAELFERTYNQYSAGKAQQDQPLILLSKQLMMELMSVVQAFIQHDWCPMPLFFAKRFPHNLAPFLINDDFRVKAVETLVDIVEHEWLLVDFEHVTSFVTMYYEYTQQIMKAKALDESEYEFNRNLCQVLAGMLDRNFFILLLKQKDSSKKATFRINSKNSDAVEKLMTLMVNFLELPALRYTEILTQPWNNVFKAHSPIPKQPWFTKNIPRILWACFEKQHKEIGNPDNVDYYDKPMTRFSALEWEDYEDFAPSLNIILGSLQQIAKGVTEADAKVCADFIVDLCKKLSACCVPNSEDEINPQTGCITTKSITFLRWDAASKIIDQIVNSMKKSNDQMSTTALPRLLESFTLLVQFQMQDPQLIGRYMTIMSRMHLLFEQNKDALREALARIEAIMRFRLPQEADVAPLDLSSPTKSARRKAHMALIHICKTIPQRMTPYLDQLLRISEHLWGQKLITAGELVFIYEALIVVSNQLNAQKRQDFLKYLLLTPKQEVVNDNVIGVCGNLEQMLKMFELIPDNDPQNQAALRLLYDKIKFALHLFVSAGDNINVQSEGHAEVGAMLYDLLRPVHSLVRSIHQFRHPDVVSKLPPISQRILAVGYLDATQLTLHGVGTSQLNAEEKRIMEVRRNLYRISNASYKIFGAVCKYSMKDHFYRNEGLHQLLTSSIFFNFNHLNSGDLTNIFRSFVLPFVQHCPEDMYSNCLMPMLLSLYQQMMVHMNREWTASLGRKNGTVQSHLSNIDEIVADFHIAGLTTTILEIPLYITKTQSTVRGPSPLFTTFIKFHPLVGLLLTLSSLLIRAPDTTSQAKVLEFIDRMLPHCAPRKEYEVVLAKEVNMSLLIALAQAKNQSLFIQALSKIFTWFVTQNLQLLQAVYQQLPHYQESTWKVLLNNHKRSIKTKHGEKKFRKLLMEYLAPISGKNFGDKIKKMGPVQQPKKQDNKADVEGMASVFYFQFGQ